MLRAIRFLQRFQKLRTEAARPGDSVFVAEAQLHTQVFTPVKNARSALILIHGIHPQGPFDTRFLAFARACAEAGFLVLAPDISLFRNFQISLETKDQIIQLVEALPNYFSGKVLDNVGLLAISYGAGPAFLAAAELQSVRYLISIGGYYNLNHAVEFLITGRHGAGANRAPQSWGHMILALNHLEALVPQEDRTLFREILLSRLSQEPNSKEQLLSLNGTALLNQLLTGLSPELASQFLQAAARHRSQFDALSPELILHRLNRNLRVYLLHGRTDTLIPFDETLELASKCKELGFANVHSFTTKSLTHVDFAMSKMLLEGIQLLSWTQAVLREA